MACSECSAPISAQSKTGRCRKCAVAEGMKAYTTEKRKAAQRKVLSDPRARARRVRQIVEAGHKARQDPAFRARISENGRRNILHAFTPEARAAWYASRAAAALKRTETMLGWCPPRLRDEYRRLLRQRRMIATEARTIIEAQITPFDRQLMKVRAGANIVELRPLKQAEPVFSLVGCGAAMCLGGAG